MRRGQVTLFVIIGLAVLLMVGLYLLLRTPSEPVSLAGIQSQAQVSAFLQQCLASTGENAIREIGVHGGYADTERFRTGDIGNAQAFLVGGQKVVLWHEVHACPENARGCVGQHVPLLCERGNRNCPVEYNIADASYSIQEAIEQVTAERIERCIDGFSPIPEYEVRKTGEHRVDALITQDAVILTLTYPIEITTQEETVEMEEFQTSLDVNLAQSYELAVGIYDAHRNQNIIEDAFLHLLAIYSGLDAPIPPFRDIQVYGTKRFWFAPRVEQAVKEDILPYLNFLQVANALESYVPIVDESVPAAYQPYATGVYRYLTINTGGGVYPLAASIQVPPDAPFSFTINNGRQVLKPRDMPGTSLLKFLGGFKFLEYKFRYTAAFPVEVKITDPYAFNGRGFELHYGLEANVRNNYPLNVSAEVVAYSAPDTTVDLSDPQQLVNHQYTVTIRDRHTGQPIPDAAVHYACGNQYQIGVTDDDGAWTGKLPYCLTGGWIVGEVTGYAGSGVRQDNSVDDGQRTTVDVDLWPVARKMVLVYKRTGADIGNLTVAGLDPSTSAAYRTNFTSNDTGFLQIARVKTTPFDDDVPLEGIFEFGMSNPPTYEEQRNTLDEALARGALTPEIHAQLVDILAANPPAGSAPGMVVMQEIEFIPGTYHVEGLLYWRGNITIPADRRCSGGVAGIGDSCITLQETNLTSWLTGGILLNGTNAFELTPEQAYGENAIALYLLEAPVPTTWRELERYQTIEQMQSYGRIGFARPEFITP